MASPMNFDIFKPTLDIFSYLSDIHVVGGALRDHLLGRPLNDIDLATSDSIPIVLEKTKHLGYKVKQIGLSFPVVLVTIGDKEYEVATFREDVNQDGRHGDFKTVSTIEEDLLRRDFTMNAMALGSNLKLKDPYGGKKDLKDKKLRFVGVVEDRIKEDYLRIIRALRFSNIYDLEICQEIKNTMNELAPLVYKNVSVERFILELEKAFKYPKAGQFIYTLYSFGILQDYIPEFSGADDLQQNPIYHPEGSVMLHIAEVVDRCDPIYRWEALFHDIGKVKKAVKHKNWNDAKPETKFYTFYQHDLYGAEIIPEIGKRLGLSNSLIFSCKQVAKYHMRYYNIVKPSKIRKLAVDTLSTRKALEAVVRADKSDNVLRDLPDVPNPPDGNYIMSTFKVSQGPIIGEIQLQYILNWIMNGEPEFDKQIHDIKKFIKTKYGKDYDTTGI